MFCAITAFVEPAKVPAHGMKWAARGSAHGGRLEEMKHGNFCKQCRTENAPEVRYCQGCGAWLEPRPPLLDSLDLRWLSGVGRRDVNVAPLFTAEPAPGPAARARVVPLPDGSWYCPDCGRKNAPHALFCGGCGREL